MRCRRSNEIGRFMTKLYQTGKIMATTLFKML
jgi:hypothetical protein